MVGSTIQGKHGPVLSETENVNNVNKAVSVNRIDGVLIEIDKDL